MVRRLALASVVLAAFVCASVMGAEEGKGAPKPKNYSGKLSAKPADAPAEVVAVLTCAARGKKDTEKQYKLTATGDVATKLTDLAAKGAEVQVKGTETGDTIAVVDVQERGAKAEGHKKEGRRKAGGQGGGQ
jgi:hypothetical protein